MKSTKITEITLTVDGTPVAKQSYRAVKGGGYQTAAVKAWQGKIQTEAHKAMLGKPIIGLPVAVMIDFYMPTRHRVDLDNLCKGALDGLKGIVFKDDDQVVELHAYKFLRRETPGIRVTIRPSMP